jgi:beta-phosphoglucomutase-like phosphatase (HAD superfamily)
VQSNWFHAAAWKIAFAQIDIDVPLEDVRRQIGKAGDELIPVFVHGGNVKLLSSH